MKKPYLTQLEGWAHWMLPRPEAEDVLADYRDIVGDPPRSGGELLRDLGKPRDVIRPLAQNKPYYTWLAVFAVLAACLLIPAISPLPGGLYPVWFTLFDPGGFLIPGVPLFLYFLAGGIAVSLIWFRPRRGEPKAPLPRPIPVLLAAELVLLAAVWWLSWQLTLYPDGIFTEQSFWLPSLIYVGPCTESSSIFMVLLEWASPIIAILGTVALVKARTRNRRWRAVYVLSLSLLMLDFCVLNTLTSMDWSVDWAFPLQYSVEITAIGLIGTGVSLC